MHPHRSPRSRNEALLSWSVRSMRPRQMSQSLLALEWTVSCLKEKQSERISHLDLGFLRNEWRTPPRRRVGRACHVQHNNITRGICRIGMWTGPFALAMSSPIVLMLKTSKDEVKKITPWYISLCDKYATY